MALNFGGEGEILNPRLRYGLCRLYVSRIANAIIFAFVKNERVQSSRFSTKIKSHPFGWLLILAEKERFELSNSVTRYTISNRAPSTN